MEMNLGGMRLTVEAQMNADVNGSFSIDKFRKAIVYANMAYFKLQVGVEEGPMYGPYWQKNQKITDALLPLLKCTGENGIPYLKTNSSGFVLVPDDYNMFSTASVIFFTDDTCTMKESEYNLDVLTDEQFNARTGSVRKKPSKKKPIMTFRNSGLVVAPKGTFYLKMSYLKQPQTPFYDFIIVDGEEVYLPPGEVHDGSGEVPAGTPSRSKEFEYASQYHVDIYNIVLGFCSGALKVNESYQISQQYKSKGQ